MVHTLLRRSLPALLAAFLLVWSITPADGCPFCSGQGPTLIQDVNQASMVLFGTLTNPKLDKGSETGTTDLQIEAVIKRHPILGDKKVLTLSRYVPVDAKKPPKFLVICDVFKDKIDPYRGIPVTAGSDIVSYLTGSLAIKEKDISGRLKHAFKYLDSADLEVNNDAYKEFANADYKDLRDMYKDLPADKIAKWLQDPNTPNFRFGLYASMLGHCGSDKHADLLRKMLDDPQKRVSTGVDGILAGYVMLKPKDGWTYLTGLLKDKSKDFMLRYASLRTIRFFWEYRPDVIQKKEMVAGVLPLLDQSDIADLAIEDLRKWGRWEVADRVLDLFDQKSHDIPIIKRSIMRFALSCPAQQARAAAFVAKMKKEKPDWVQDIEELLKLETVPPAPASTASSAKK
jgi:hypothetical protein